MARGLEKLKEICKRLILEDMVMWSIVLKPDLGRPGSRVRLGLSKKQYGN